MVATSEVEHSRGAVASHPSPTTPTRITLRSVLTPAKAPRRRIPKRNGDPHSPGRPHDLDRPVSFGGQQLPAAEAIVAIMRSGEPLYLAAQACGLNPDTAYNWRRDGQRTATDLYEGRTTDDELTDYQRSSLSFSEAASRAEAEAEALMAARLGQVAAGGAIKKRTVIDYDAAGIELGRRVTEEIVPADPKAISFWLERRAPERWGRAQRIEHAIGAEGPRVQTDTPLERLSEALRAMERRKAATAHLIPAVDSEDEAVGA